ncbi:hypothetical protein N7492_006356 [Penicillium capsulatum]|uniref:Uncharacterized protein n=1 Tax=Penicillium capsulatum TaxID=69766 RepID=A0A9W9LMK7_9EURO|nr:hypothetical protein N7492_006356 [Penicillium capsulatum]
MKKSARKHDYSSLTITEALSQLLDAAEMIELRQSVKPHEEKRITGAFHLINQPEYDPKTKSDQRRENFKHLLKKLRADCGPELVIACALGLGQTAFANMREVYRLRLPNEVTKRKEKFKSPYIQGLAKSYCCKAVENHEQSTQGLHMAEPSDHRQPQENPIILPTSGLANLVPSSRSDMEVHFPGEYLS